MRDLLQRMCILLMLCVGAAAFIATSPPFTPAVEKSVRPITIKLTKARPNRQFTITVKNNQTPNISFGQTGHLANFRVTDAEGFAPKEAKIRYSVAVAPLDTKPNHCFTAPDECDWEEKMVGDPIEDGLRQNTNVTGPFLFNENLPFTNGGARVFIKFKLEQDEPTRLTWTYTIARTPSGNQDDQKLNSPLVDITSQEIPVE